MPEVLQTKEKRAEMGREKSNQETSGNQVQRDKHGRLLPGSKLNPLGPAIKEKLDITPKDLLESLKEVEKAKQKPFLKHLWERAYRSDAMAKAMLDKFIANKGLDISKFTGAGQFNVIIQTYSGEKGEKPVNIDITPEPESKE